MNDTDHWTFVYTNKLFLIQCFSDHLRFNLVKKKKLTFTRLEVCVKFKQLKCFIIIFKNNTPPSQPLKQGYLNQSRRSGFKLSGLDLP